MPFSTRIMTLCSNRGDGLAKVAGIQSCRQGTGSAQYALGRICSDDRFENQPVAIALHHAKQIPSFRLAISSERRGKLDRAVTSFREECAGRREHAERVARHSAGDSVTRAFTASSANRRFTSHPARAAAAFEQSCPGIRRAQSRTRAPAPAVVALPGLRLRIFQAAESAREVIARERSDGKVSELSRSRPRAMRGREVKVAKPILELATAFCDPAPAH